MGTAGVGALEHAVLMGAPHPRTGCPPGALPTLKQVGSLGFAARVGSPMSVEPSDPWRLEADRAAVDGFRRGEPAIFARIVETFIDDIARTVRAGVMVRVDGQPTRVGGGLPEQEVEALVQETFRKVFEPRARASYDGLRPFGAWLATIARHLLIDRARKEATARRHTATVDDLEALALDEGGIDDALETQELRSLIDAFLQERATEDRELFRVRFVEGLSLRQAAKALSRSFIGVRRRDARLRADLHTALVAAGYLEGVGVRIGTSVLGRGAVVAERIPRKPHLVGGPHDDGS